MFLYIAGAVNCQVLIVNYAAYDITASSNMSSGETPFTAGKLRLVVAVPLFCLTWFCMEYLYFEHIHLYTYDLFAERVGFKLCWGCLVFYPYFYSIPVVAVSGENITQDASFSAALFSIVLFYMGWIMTRGANYQKYCLKAFPSRKTCYGGFVNQITVPGSSGRLLCSGFWGFSRHLNYLGEILQALAVSFPSATIGVYWPLLYPLYYVLLFVGREQDDAAICAAKYGAAWDKYVKKVPWKIVPFVY
mmetsp:Transcript_25887/g.36165  ORF Transcript_25887/g.36165 Transcript_25887/m.36165 type:complete len:247 (+) Transcript_25887:792-1532(+)